MSRRLASTAKTNNKEGAIAKQWNASRKNRGKITGWKKYNGSTRYKTFEEKTKKCKKMMNKNL